MIRGFMRLLLAILFLIASAGCSRPERLSDQAAEAMAQVQRWVGLGTPATEARQIMEQRGFACSMVTNGAFGTHRGVDYIFCDRREGTIVKRRWQAALVLVEGRVSEVQVTTGLVGP